MAYFHTYAFDYQQPNRDILILSFKVDIQSFYPIIEARYQGRQ